MNALCKLSACRCFGQPLNSSLTPLSPKHPKKVAKNNQSINHKNTTYDLKSS